MPHRHWLLRNNIDPNIVPEEVVYQELEITFRFTEKRHQIMMELSIIRAFNTL